MCLHSSVYESMQIRGAVAFHLGDIALFPSGGMGKKARDPGMFTRV